LLAHTDFWSRDLFCSRAWILATEAGSLRLRSCLRPQISSTIGCFPPDAGCLRPGSSSWPTNGIM